MDALSDEVLSQIFELAIWPAPLHYFLDDTALANDREIGGLLEMPPAKKLGVRGVCRHWCRLATPIWLRYVLLNAQGPIKRLGYMLYKYPDLGKHVRYLRIGAEHAKLLDSVVKYLTNVETLCIYAQMQPNRHSNEGTLTALQRLNPVRLYIHGIRPMQMTPVWKSKEIREALYEAIRNRFTKLVRTFHTFSFVADVHLVCSLGTRVHCRWMRWRQVPSQGPAVRKAPESHLPLSS